MSLHGHVGAELGDGKDVVPVIQVDEGEVHESGFPYDRAVASEFIFIGQMVF